jgi:hypothetical protein
VLFAAENDAEKQKQATNNYRPAASPRAAIAEITAGLRVEVEGKREDCQAAQRKEEHMSLTRLRAAGSYCARTIVSFEGKMQI